MTSTQATTPVTTNEVAAPVADKKSSNPVGIIKRTNAFFIDPKRVQRREGFNPRFDFGEIEELAASIRVNGMLNPIRVKRLPVTGDSGFVFELIDGDRRLTACEAIIKKDPEFFAETGIPAILVEKTQDDITSLIQMFEANSGKTFLPLEEAAAYKRMRDAGMSLKQIGEKVSRKHVHIVATLALLEADPELQAAVKDGSVNSTIAKKIAVAARGDKGKQKALVADVKAAGKDKGKRRVVAQKVEQARLDRAKKEGRVLKIRALTDDQLSKIGAKMSEVLMAQMADIGIDAEADMMGWVKAGDKDLKASFTFGILQGLKAAAGLQVDLLTD